MGHINLPLSPDCDRLRLLIASSNDLFAAIKDAEFTRQLAERAAATGGDCKYSKIRGSLRTIHDESPLRRDQIGTPQMQSATN
jgi:hypothetical protein